MTADQCGEQVQAGGARMVQRLLRRISAARSGRSARADREMHPAPLVTPFATVDERNAP